MTEGKPRLSKVTIGGVDVSSVLVGPIGWDLNPLLAQTIKSIDISLTRNVYNLVPDLQTSPGGISVVVQRGVTVATEQTVFQGEVITRDTLGGRVILNCNGKFYEAVKENVTKTFDSNVDTEAGKISEIFKTLINDFTDLTADDTSVTDSGTTIILKKFICNNADVFERCQRLMELLDWQMFYDPMEDKVFAQPKGSRAGTDTLTIGTNVTNRPRWKRDSKKVVKKTKLFGGPIETETQETFTAIASQTDFELAKIPISSKVTVDGVLQTGGIEGQETGADYFVETVTKSATDRNVGNIKFQVAMTGGESVVVDYSFASPIAINGEGAAKGLSIRLDRPDITTVDDAREYLSKYLLRHSTDFLSTTLTVTNVTNLETGQSVRVVDVNEGIDEYFIITRVIKRFPYSFDEVQVDTEPLEIENWQISAEDRIRRIEEKLLQEETLVIFLKTGSRTLKLGREFFKKETRDIRDGGGEYSWIWGHPDAAVWGTNLFGDRRQAAVLKFLGQGADTYLEDFLNTDFRAAATTATWGSTGSATFTSGQNATSNEVDFNNGTVTQARLTSTEVSGAFDYEMTADYLVPIAHYKMNDNAASTVVVDSIGGTNGVATANTDILTTTGQINEALNFDGQTERVNVTHNILLAQGSVALWFNKRGVTGDAGTTAAIFNADKHSRTRIAITDSGVPEVIKGNPLSSISMSSVADNEWHHIILCWEETSTTTGNFWGYLDGVITAVDTFTHTQQSHSASAIAALGSVNDNFNGDVDDVRMYSKTLNQAEASAIVNSGNGTEESNANWEAVTSGALHTFTNPGTDMRWRATENAASTGEISQILIDQYH